MRYICQNALPEIPGAAAPTTTTVYQDALARLQQAAPLVPLSPMLSNPFEPTTADLVAYAAHMMALASGCAIHAAPGEARNPWASIGALTVLTERMHRWLSKRLAEEEKALLLTERLRHEHNQECAHEKLMAEDSDYADEYLAEIEGDDEVPHE